MTNVFIRIDAPLYTWGGGNKQTNVYGVSKDKDDATLPTFGDAQVVYTMPSALTFAAIPSEPGRLWHLWVKFESYAGVESVSPTGGINGQSVTVGDAENLIESLQVATAWIDSAMVANLSAAHLTVGDGTVGGPLKSTNYVPSTSGWLLDAALGRIYAMDAVLSGTVYADYGSIGGIGVFSNSLESSNFDGAGTGFSISANGKITAGSISVKNVGSTRIFNTEAIGTNYILKVDDTISINADGEMTLSAVDVIDTISIKGEAITETFIAQASFDQVIDSDTYQDITQTVPRDFNGKYLVTITGQSESVDQDSICNLALFVNDVHVYDINFGVRTGGANSSWKMPVCINYGGASAGSIQFKLKAKVTEYSNGSLARVKVGNFAICFNGYKR